MPKAIAEQIFHYEHVTPEHYSQSSNLNLGRYKEFFEDCSGLASPQRGYEVPLLHEMFDGVEGLGPFERYVLELLVNPPFTVNAIIGARGSGKTSSMQFLEYFVRKNSKAEKAHLSIYVDCNNAPVSEKLSFQARKDAVYRYIADRTIEILLQSHAEKLRYSFENAISTNDYPPAAALGDLLNSMKKMLVKGSARYLADPEVQDQVRAMRAAVQAVPAEELRFALSLLALVRMSAPNVYTFFCIDNADRLDPILQEDMLWDKTSFVNEFRVPVLVPVRVITYRLQDHNSFVINCFGHSGVTPLQEARKRASAALNGHAESNPKVKSASVGARVAFTSRLLQLDYLFSQGDDLKDFFRALSGRSVQRGLAIIQRLFAVVPEADMLMAKLDDDSKAALSGLLLNASGGTPPDLAALTATIRKVLDEQAQRALRDYQVKQLMLIAASQKENKYGPLVANLFRLESEGDRLNLSKYHILQYLFQKRGRDTRLRDLVKAVNRLGYEVDQVVTAIDELHEIHRRLLWHTAAWQLETPTKLQDHLSSPIGITASGVKYLEHLAGDLDYMSFCLSLDIAARLDLSVSAIAPRMLYMGRVFYDALLDELRGDVDGSTDDRERWRLQSLLRPLLGRIRDNLLKHVKNLRLEDNNDRLRRALGNTETTARDLVSLHRAVARLAARKLPAAAEIEFYNHEYWSPLGSEIAACRAAKGLAVD